MLQPFLALGGMYMKPINEWSKCSLEAAFTSSAKRKNTAAWAFVGVLVSALCLPINLAAQADAQSEQQQEAQAQRNDLAAEIEALKREIEDIKAQLARITTVQRIQGEQLLQQQPQPSAAPPAAVVPPSTRQVRPQESVPANAPTPPTPTAADTATPTVFVFKDGTRTEAHNYAIVGGTLWIYTDQEAKKYAVSYIDVAASTAANASRGNKFQIPESR
jgi:hypothetical protein